MNQFDQRQAEVVRRNETPFAALSLRRTALVALTANAFTNITWQTQIRGIGITWNGTTTITIPTAGYYSVSLSYATSATTNSVVSIVVNGTIALNMGAITATTIPTTAYHSTITRYFNTADTFTVRIYSTNAVNLVANAEHTSSESPILHVVQLTGAIP